MYVCKAYKLYTHMYKHMHAHTHTTSSTQRLFTNEYELKQEMRTVHMKVLINSLCTMHRDNIFY